MRRRTFLHALPAVLAAGSARAQAAPYPSRLVRLIVPFPPAGNADLVARVLAERLASRFEQPVIVENRPGASATLGAEAVARSAPDGHTLLLSNNVSLATGPLVNRHAGYRPLEDLAHLFRICTFPNALVVRADHPARTLGEFIDLARARSGELRYGSAAIGSAGHLTGTLLEQRAGLKLMHVPYKGIAPATADLLGGAIDALFDGLPTALQQQSAGRVRVLAVTSAQRVPRLPQVPALAELAPGAVGLGWFGVSAAARTPAAVMDRIEQEGLHCARMPEVHARLAELGCSPDVAGAADYTRFVAAEIAKWAPVVAATGIRTD